MLSGTGGLSQLGTGSLILAANNTYSGSTTIANGSTLQVGNGGTSGTIGTGSISNSGTLAFNRSDNVTISGVLSGTGGLSQLGTGSLILAADNTYSGTTTISSGTLQVGNGGSSGALGAGSVVNNGTLTFNRNDDVTINNVISGTGNLIKTGSGVLTLLSSNTYSGTTTINAGTLSIGSSDTLSGGQINVNSATLDITLLSNSSTLSNALNLNNASVSDFNYGSNNTFSGNILMTGTNYFNIAGQDTLSGILSGSSIELHKQEAGVLTLTNANTFTGTSFIDAGVINIQHSSALGHSSATATIGQSAALVLTGNSLNVANNLTFDDNSYLLENVSNNTSSLSGNVTLNGTVTLIVANPSDDKLSLSGAISGTGVTINKIGLGTIALSGNNSFTGDFNIYGGRIQVDSSTALGSSTVTLNAPNNATMILNGTSLVLSNSIILNDGSTLIDNNSGGTNAINGSVTVNGSSIINVNNTNNSLTISGDLINNSSLSKIGTGTLLISGNNTSFTGTMNVDEGTLSVSSNATALGSSTVNVNTNSTFNIAGSLGANFANEINLIDATFTSSGTNALTGVITLTGNNTLNTSGILTIGSSSLLSGSDTLTVSGSGTVIMASGGANNTYSGDIRLSNGTLRAGHASNPFGSGVLNLNGGTLDASVTTVLANSSFAVGGNATIGGSNNITLPTGVLSSGTLTISDSGIVNFNGALSGSGAMTMTNGTTRFSANNGSYSGTLSLSGGSLQINNNNVNPLGTGQLALNGGTLSAIVSLSNPVTNALSVGGNASIGGSNSITFSGASTLASGNTLSISNTGTTTMSGSVSGSGNINVNAGTFILSGDNTGFNALDSYAGITTVSGVSSIFRVSNNQALGYSSVVASSSGTLNLNNVTIGNNNPITLNNGNMTTDGTVIFASPITLSNSSTDVINVNAGSVFTLNNNINGAGSLSLNGAGDMIMNGEIGNVTPLNSLTTNVNITYGGTTAITLYDQTQNGIITLINDAKFESLLGNIYVNASINGNHPLIVQANHGTTYLYGMIGGVDAISNFEALGPLFLGNGLINSTGSQIYSGSVTLGANTTLTSSSGDIRINDHINGGHYNLTINANNVVLGGDVNANELTASGITDIQGSQITTTGAQQYQGDVILNNNVTLSANGITLSGNVDGRHHALSLNDQRITVINNHIDNLSNFIANNVNINNGGMTTSGNQIFNGVLTLGDNTTLTTMGSGSSTIAIHAGLNGGGYSLHVIGSDLGIKTFLLNSGNAQTWTINANNAGTVSDASANHVDFINIQNINGSNSNNQFVFQDGAIVTGTVNGASLNNTNLLDFSHYTTPIGIQLSTTNNGMAMNGTNTVAHFTNVTNLIGNNNLDNYITLPTKSGNSVVLTGVKSGYVNDPIYFDGFLIFRSLTGLDIATINVPAIIDAAAGLVTINGVTMQFINFLQIDGLSEPIKNKPVLPLVPIPTSISKVALSIITSEQTGVAHNIFKIDNQFDPKKKGASNSLVELLKTP